MYQPAINRASRVFVDFGYHKQASPFAPTQPSPTTSPHCAPTFAVTTSLTMDRSPLTVGLNRAQQAAVTSPAPVIQILAPPGSGKTKTLTTRVSHLLQHHHYRPWDVICLTFTIKSAREMRERIARLIGNGLESKIILGTFHSVCLRYLRTYGHSIGLRKGFSIADASDSQAIITRLTKQLKLSTIDPRVARSRISSCKARNHSYEDLRKPNKKSNVDQEEFAAIFEAYESHLEVSNLLDYDDLLLRCVQLLRSHPSCVSNVEAVLIDEFQDTNHVQFELMTLFASANKRITTVGDPDQSIYGWRSAEVTNLGKMQRLYPETLVVHLEDNYRSSGSILLAALEVIQQDQARPDKPLLPTHCPGTIPTLRHLPHAAAEAQWIVSEIKRCISLTGKQLLTHSDFAILLRSASLSRQIEAAMGRVGMPYRMVGGARFFDRTEIKILLDYLRVIKQQDNTEALARILNIPSRRVGDTTIKSLLEEASAKSITLWTLVQKIVQGGPRSQTKITSVAEKGLTSFYNIIVTARRKMLEAETLWGPKEIIYDVIDKLDFKTYLERHHPEDHETRWANVEELIAQASDSQSPSNPSTEDDKDESLPQIEGVEQSIIDTGEVSLAQFLENVALSTELQRNDDEVDDAGREQSRVTISTIHAAKGLEWPIIFIPSVYQGSIPHSRAEDCDEERRLLYVAMTRAQALLYLSCPKRNSTGEETTLSPFVSTKQVGAFLTDRGPTIQHDTIQDICRILKRTCPTQETLLNDLQNADNTEDDLWPYDGTQHRDAAESRWDPSASSTYQYTGQKRKSSDELSHSRRNLRPAASTSLAPSLNTTMQNRGSFTITPHTSGFVSASTQLQQHSAPLKRSQSVPEGTASTSNTRPSQPSNLKGKASSSSILPGVPYNSTSAKTIPSTLEHSPTKPTGICYQPSTSSIVHSKPTGAHLSASTSSQSSNSTRQTPYSSNPASLPLNPITKRQKTAKIPSNQGSLSAFFKPRPPDNEESKPKPPINSTKSRNSVGPTNQKQKTKTYLNSTESPIQKSHLTPPNTLADGGASTPPQSLQPKASSTITSTSNPKQVSSFLPHGDRIIPPQPTKSTKPPTRYSEPETRWLSSVPSSDAILQRQSTDPHTSLAETSKLEPATESSSTTHDHAVILPKPTATGASSKEDPTTARAAMSTLPSSISNLLPETAARKSLGMRRRTAGWSAGGARPFKPPSGARPQP